MLLLSSCQRAGEACEALQLTLGSLVARLFLHAGESFREERHDARLSAAAVLLFVVVSAAGAAVCCYSYYYCCCVLLTDEASAQA